MEAFASCVSLLPEPDTYINRRASSVAIKFPVTPCAATSSHVDTHPEVDLVGGRQNLLVLATATPFLGSHVSGHAITKRCNSLYALINDASGHSAAIYGRCERHGYPIDKSELRLYDGTSAGTSRIRVRRAACHARTIADLKAGDVSTAVGGARWHPSTIKPASAWHDLGLSAEGRQAGMRVDRIRVRIPPSSDSSSIEHNVGRHASQTQREEAVGRR